MFEQYIAIFNDSIADEVASELEPNPIVNSTYKLSEFALVIRTPALAPRVLSDTIGFGENRRGGVVFKMNGSYHGYFRKTLWDWLKENTE